MGKKTSLQPGVVRIDFTGSSMRRRHLWLILKSDKDGTLGFQQLCVAL